MIRLFVVCVKPPEADSKIINFVVWVKPSEADNKIIVVWVKLSQADNKSFCGVGQTT